MGSDLPTELNYTGINLQAEVFLEKRTVT